MARDKMRHQCNNQGCFLKHKVADLTVFDDCFSGNMGMGDIDGWIEVNNHYLVLEFKGFDVPTPTGQQILFKRLTGGRKEFIVVVVEIDLNTMETRHITKYYNGREYPKEACNYAQLKQYLTIWNDKARR